MIYTLDAWEIDAAIAWHLTGLFHRLAARAFVRRPSPRTARVLNAARHAVRIVGQLSEVPQFNEHTRHR